MGDGCHVTTPLCVTTSLPPTTTTVLPSIYIIRYLEGDHLSEPQHRNGGGTTKKMPSATLSSLSLANCWKQETMTGLDVFINS